MHKSRPGIVIIDCQTDDLEPEARFWGPFEGWSATGIFAAMHLDLVIDVLVLE